MGGDLRVNGWQDGRALEEASKCNRSCTYVFDVTVNERIPVCSSWGKEGYRAIKIYIL